MAKPARQREALHLELIYRHHPLIVDAQPMFWTENGERAPLEGGDIFVLGNSCLMVGIGERTLYRKLQEWKKADDEKAAGK